MFGIGNIKVNGNGKTPEEIKKEILEQVGEQVDVMLKSHNETKEKIEKKTEARESRRKVSIIMTEDKEATGFGCEVEYHGDFKHVMTMLTVGVARALQQISESCDDEYNPDLLLQFIMALIGEYIGMNDDEEEE